MNRQETAETTREPASRAVATPAVDPRSRLLGLTGLLLILLVAARVASAEPSELPAVSAPPPASLAFVEHAPHEESTLPAIAPPIEQPPVTPDLAELFFVSDADSARYRPKTTDEILAAAVALGTNPDLEPLNPFRKRSRDLFRTERPVTIGDRELVMRLRLRAKAKRAVSVEFRF